MAQQTFTRKEVIQLLKKQRDKSVNSYGRMPAPILLSRHPDYFTEMVNTFKRLKNVTLIKF